MYKKQCYSYYSDADFSTLMLAFAYFSVANKLSPSGRIRKFDFSSHQTQEPILFKPIKRVFGTKSTALALKITQTFFIKKDLYLNTDCAKIQCKFSHHIDDDRKKVI